MNNGGPAFPSHGSMGEVVQEGMSLRDWFAGQALAGMGIIADAEAWKLAAWAYETADAMLAEREKAK